VHYFMIIGGSKPETALFTDAHPSSVTSKGAIIESSTECCGLNSSYMRVFNCVFAGSMRFALKQ
jgi:hypothetical protein